MKFFDRIKETTTTTGTGNITLAGAATNFQTFTSEFATNEIFSYAIIDDTNNAWEVGLGHLSASTTLVRDQVYDSTNAGALVNFSAGTKNVICTIPAYRMTRVDIVGHTYAKYRGTDMP